MEIFTEIIKFGGSTAAIAIVGYFIVKDIFKYLETRDKRCNEKDERIAKLIGNHMNHNTTVLNELIRVVSELSIYIKKINGK